MRIDPGNAIPVEVQAAIIRIAKRGDVAQVKYIERDGVYKVYSLHTKLECADNTAWKKSKGE